MALDPVEIEILMKQNVSEESQKASSGMDKMSESSKILKEQIEIQKNVISDLEARYTSAKAIFDSVNIGTNDSEIIARREQASKLFKEVQFELNGEKLALSELEKELNKQTSAQDKVNKSAQSYLSQMREIREEMAQMRGNSGLVDPENLARYDELKKKLEEIGTSYNVVRQEQKLVATAGNAQLAGMIQGMAGFAGVFSALQGGLSLVSSESENFAKIQTKLQAAMAITIGLQQVSNTLHATSTFRLATVTKLTQLWAAAQNRLTASLWGSQLAAQSLMAVITVGLSVAITGLIYLYDKYKTKQDEIDKKNQEVADKAIDFNNKVAESVAKPITSYKKLQAEWNSLGDSLVKKKKFVTENKKEFENLGIEVNNVADAENVLVNNTEAVITAFRLRAQAVAYQELATESYKKAAKAQAEADKFVLNNSKETTGKLNIPGQEKPIDFTFNVNSDPLKMQNDELLKNIIGTTKNGFTQAAETAEKEGDKLTDVYVNLQQKGREELKKAGIKSFSDIGKSAETEAERLRKKAEKEQEQRDKANETLLKKSADYQAKIDASRVAAMAEGAEKERTAIRAEYDKTKALIEEELREIERLETITGKPATAQRSELFELDSAATAEYEAKTNQLNATTQKAINDIFSEVNQKFQSELNNNLDNVNRYYDQIIKEAKEAGATIDQVNELNAQRKKELDAVSLDSQRQQLEFEAQIALRRLAISGKTYLFESDKIKENVNLQKKAKQEELEILKKKFAKSPTSELANEIEEATLAIDEMDKVLSKLSTQKFQEVSEYVSQIASGLSSLVGADSGEGKMLEWASGLASGGAKIASGDPMAMIDGAFQVANTVKDIFSTASKARREIREFAYELEQAAIGYSLAIISAVKDIKSINDSLFYQDTSNALTQGMTGYSAAVQKEIELTNKLGDTSVAVGKKKKKFMGITVGTKTIWEGILTGYKKVLDTDDELIDKNGQVNREIADSLLASGKLSKEATNLLNQIVEAQDAAKAAMEQVESTLESLAGSLGDDLKSSLVNAFTDGDALSAAKNFKENVQKTLSDIVVDKLFSQVFGSMLGDLEDKMKESYSDGGDESLVDDIIWFYEQSQAGMDSFNAQLEQAKKELKEKGIDILNDSDRQGSQGGLSNASQDSINELQGGVNAVLYGVTDIRNIEKESLLLQKTWDAKIDAIVDNTAHCALLIDVKKHLEDMVTRGVKLKA